VSLWGTSPSECFLEQGLKAEIDSASKIYFRMKGVKPPYTSFSVELKYILSKMKLFDKTEFIIGK